MSVMMEVVSLVAGWLAGCIVCRVSGGAEMSDVKVHSDLATWMFIYRHIN